MCVGFWFGFFFASPGDFEEESKQPPVTDQQKHQLKHRELFLSRQFESLPATHIRYKSVFFTHATSSVISSCVEQVVFLVC